MLTITLYYKKTETTYFGYIIRGFILVCCSARLFLIYNKIEREQKGICERNEIEYVKLVATYKCKYTIKPKNITKKKKGTKQKQNIQVLNRILIIFYRFFD